MAASLMHRGQQRHERISLRVATFLKRCGRDPETGQLLTLTGHRVEDAAPPEHLASLRVFKNRQRRQHQWTPKLPQLSTNGTRDASDWHEMLQDDDFDIVHDDYEAAMSAGRDRAGTAAATKLHPAEFYLPPANRAATKPGETAGPVSGAEYAEALELTDIFLNKDTTHHVSLRHLREDNRHHRVAMSQVVRGDGMDKVTSGVPPEKRHAVRPGRVDIVLPGAGADDAQRVVSRLVSQKQLTKEKYSHSVAMVARYQQQQQSS